MNRFVTIAAALAVAAATTSSYAAPAKGVKCGNSYIAAGLKCTKPAPKPAAKPASKGVKCGNGYIAAGLKCTKK